MMKLLFLIALLPLALAVKDTTETRDAFRTFMKDFGKVYTTNEEFKQRYVNFLENLDDLPALRKEHPTATFGITQFFDMTKEEWKGKYILPKPLTPEEVQKVILGNEGCKNFEISSIKSRPSAWDWRDHGALTPVKNQEQCGSCWAFATTESIESHWFLAGNDLPVLAPQQLVDCDHECDNAQICDSGCNGGWMWNAMTYVKSNGLELEKDYPYTARDGECQADPSKYVAHITNFTCVGSDETEMANYLYDHGPYTVAVNAGLLFSYTGGVLNPTAASCNNHALDHAVLLSGYGNDAKSSLDFWLVRNSWGATWGLEGYFMIRRGTGACGINMAPTSPGVIHK